VSSKSPMKAITFVAWVLWRTYDNNGGIPCRFVAMS
jgi:hypothetical protein